MQETFDRLYAESRNGNNFYKLYEIITSKQNIRLAYRNLKKNPGSFTAGVDGKTMEDIKGKTEQYVIQKVHNKLNNYQPQPVRRVYIPKIGSDKGRPLGIPTIWDRLIQQCILQVLEPVCEPKFHNHSYGFRQNRSCEHAVSRVVTLINIAKHHYCVDVDIKGFFDNVNHGKLLKQIWALGIRDKRIISIISKILKAEIYGEGIPTKGTPQGGIISPLLSLIVLNELDWWVSNQWETYSPNRRKRGGSGWYQYAKKHTNMKDGFIVRYCDDFKIMCETYQEAKRYYHATVDFLDKRLGLEISREKSKVVNLKRNSSIFLGFKTKVIPKGKSRNGYVAKTDMSRKAIRKTKQTMKKRILNIVKKDTFSQLELYNTTVLGIQNYYRIATNIYNNLREVNYAILPVLRIRLRRIAKKQRFSKMEDEFKEQTYGLREDTKIYVIRKTGLFPIQAVRRKNPLNFSQETCDYTRIGRIKIHNDLTLKLNELEINDYLRNPFETMEFNDNIISKFTLQKGNCFISKTPLEPSHCIAIRKEPNRDDYKNIVIINQYFAKVISQSEENLSISLENISINSKMKSKLLEIKMSN